MNQQVGRSIEIRGLEIAQSARRNGRGENKRSGDRWKIEARSGRFAESLLNDFQADRSLPRHFVQLDLISYLFYTLGVLVSFQAPLTAETNHSAVNYSFPVDA